MRTSSATAHRPSHDASARQGAAVVEAALVLSAATLLMFGALDASLAVFRRNILENAVCKAARVAALHGSRSGSPLGPAVITVDASQNHVLANAIRPMLASLSPVSVAIQASWPDDDNENGCRVTVRLSTPSPSLVAVLFGGTWTIHVAATVPVAH